MVAWQVAHRATRLRFTSAPHHSHAIMPLRILAIVPSCFWIESSSLRRRIGDASTYRSPIPTAFRTALSAAVIGLAPHGNDVTETMRTGHSVLRGFAAAALRCRRGKLRRHRTEWHRHHACSSERKDRQNAVARDGVSSRNAASWRK